MSMVDLSPEQSEEIEKLYHGKCFSLNDLPTEPPIEESEVDTTSASYKFSRTRTSRLKSWAYPPQYLTQKPSVDPRKLLLKRAVPMTVKPVSSKPVHRKAKSLMDSSLSKQTQEVSSISSISDVTSKPKLSKERHFRRKSSLTQNEGKGLVENKLSENWISDHIKSNSSVTTRLLARKTRHVSDVSAVLASIKLDSEVSLETFGDSAGLTNSSIFSMSSVKNVRSILKNRKGTDEVESERPPIHHGKTHSMIFLDCKKVKFS